MTTVRDPKLLSSRDPYPFPKLQNDSDFQGLRSTEKMAYPEPVHIAQQQNPWYRLNTTPTLSSVRHEIYHFDPQSPRDSLDFILKAQYDHHEELLKNKNETLFQPETLGLEHGRILKNRVHVETKPAPNMNHPISINEQKKKENVNGVKNAIESHHTQTTNRGYSRKPDGGFFCS